MIKGVRTEQRKATVAQVKALAADLELLQYRISQAELRAPVNAVVRARLQEPGDMTSAQKPVYTLALTEPKWVRVWIDEGDLGRIKSGSHSGCRENTPREVRQRAGLAHAADMNTAFIAIVENARAQNHKEGNQ
ncbi:MAG: HlyD family efflux transporter periplasmic adaptor subunit [Enterobacterales bacterium endosymbiont of Blomia tropicalis]|uniref:HlyD family efflux transporter periplasmic adaptor subunit n=1 Tax=Mixta mediterraneensis TaxID=2758443 RepID=UPI0025A763F9|nr:HlyD family efflux transporter periplasmic adaptor subunit [Mixta mediterraneensis]MDL4915740.1 HlyD family efflux transporter periplasmic adaptor subunit [Mixta mediterraneensis]